MAGIAYPWLATATTRNPLLIAPLAGCYVDSYLKDVDTAGQSDCVALESSSTDVATRCTAVLSAQ